MGRGGGERIKKREEERERQERERERERHEETLREKEIQSEKDAIDTFKAG